MPKTPYQPRMSRGFRIDLPPDDGLPCIEHLAELRLHAHRNFRKYLADSPSQVVIHRQSVDRGEPVVDHEESNVSVEIAEADRGVSVETHQLFL